LLRLLYGEKAEHYLIKQAENGSIRTDAEGQ
jgi:hypothetical protein